MRVALIANTASGRGHAAAPARDIRAALEREGHEVDQRAARDPAAPDAIRAARVAVIVGGDGTVHHQLAALAGAGCDADAAPALWHAPTGTENLFARQFGMTARADDLLKAMRAMSDAPASRVDVATLNGRLFAIMAGIGPDARIVARVAAARAGPISKRSYAWPATLEAFRPSLPRMIVHADGERVVNDEPGFIVVANSPHYGGRLNPARDARVDDGLLDVVFFPCRSRVRAMSWTLGCRLGRQGRSPWLVSRRASSIRLEIDPAHRAMLQLDGEAAGDAGGVLDIRVRPGALRVLMPAGNRDQGRSKSSASATPWPAP